MADLSFVVSPVAFADALYNAAVMAQDTGGRLGCPHVLVCYQNAADGLSGVVLVYGASRIIAGKTTVPLEGQAPDDFASVAIGRDHAEQVQSALRQLGRAKSTRVTVRISDEGFDVVQFDEDGDPEVVTVNFAVQKDEEILAELADSDPGREYARHFDIVDDYLVGSGTPLAGPAAFNFEAVKRVTSLKGLGATMLDLAQTTRPHILAIASGPHFRGILGELDREVYAGADGERADHLLN